MKKQEIKIEKSSGNIFQDLGFKDSGEILAKAELVIKINEIIKRRGYTQKQAAEILNIDQPKISALKNGRLRGFSLERIFQFLNLLNYNVEITIRDRSELENKVKIYA